MSAWLLVGGGACQSRAVAIFYVGEDAGLDASAGGSSGRGESGSGAAAGSAGVGARAGSGGAADAGPDAPVDAGLDAEPDVAPPDGDVPDVEQPDADVPPTEHCKPAADWSETDTSLELALLGAVNQRRALGIACDGIQYATAPALELGSELRCSARLHARDMVARNYFSLTTPDGLEPVDRMLAAGWEDLIWGENIFLGDESPKAVVTLWISAGGDQCRNLVNPRFVIAGVGHYENRWALDLGSKNGTEPADVPPRIGTLPAPPAGHADTAGGKGPRDEP